MYFGTILAMTFTNKAANEMRSRIIGALQDLSTPDKNKTEKQLSLLRDYSSVFQLPEEFLVEKAESVLRKILHRYSFFSVMTLDKFTHKIIRTFARDLNISMDFDVELDVAKLKADASNLLMEKIGQNKALTQLMMRYAITNIEDDRAWDFSNDLIAFSNELFKEAAFSGIEKLKKLPPEKFLEISESMRAANKNFEKKIIRNAQEAVDLIKSKNIEIEDFKGKSISVYNYFKKLSNGIPAKASDFQPSATVIGDSEKQTYVGKQNPNLALIEITPLLVQYFNQIYDLVESELPQYLIRGELIKELNNLSLLRHLSLIVEDLKEEQNILLISDFYKKISEVIQNEPVPYIYERLGARYNHFLLDEFQDTSHLQWVNVVPLIHNAVAAENQNLIVGDGKQAIYRWRNGEVAQFVKLPEEVYNPSGIASLTEAEYQFKAAGIRKNLEANYRSAPLIVNFNNSLFENISNKYGGEIKAIYKDLSQIPKREKEGYVEVNIRKGLNKEDELAYLFNSIEKTIEAGFSYADIAILVDTNKNGKTIAEFLLNKGIGVISPDSLHLEKSEAVQLIMNLLQNHITPFDLNTKLMALSLLGQLKKDKDPVTLSREFKEKLKTEDLAEVFAQLGFTLPRFGIYLNLYELVLAIAQSLALDFVNDNFLNYFLNQVYEFEKKWGNNLRAFLDWFEQKGKKQSVVAPKGNNSVQIMTIHKSKGLEFPVVMTPFMNMKTTSKDNVIWIEKEENNLPAFYLKATSKLADSVYAEEYETEAEKTTLDTLNKLYVAFTRAASVLFISGNANGIAKDWLLPFLDKNAETNLGFTKENETFKAGILVSREEKKENPNVLNIDLQSVIFNKPTLSTQGSLEAEIEEREIKKSYGKDLHLVLSKISSFEDVDNSIQTLLSKGVIEKENTTQIKTEIEQLFQDDHFKKYFEQETILNEKVILDKDGKQHIPDKVIITNNRTTVVDFKTGKPLKKHAKQVKNYVALLTELGLPNVDGEIYYTQEKRVKAV